MRKRREYDRSIDRMASKTDTTGEDIQGRRYDWNEIRESIRECGETVGEGSFGTAYKVNLGDKIVVVKLLGNVQLNEDVRPQDRARVPISNACPECGWFASDINQWPRWNGRLSANVTANRDAVQIDVEDDRVRHRSSRRSASDTVPPIAPRSREEEELMLARALSMSLGETSTTNRSGEETGRGRRVHVEEDDLRGIHQAARRRLSAERRGNLDKQLFDDFRWIWGGFGVSFGASWASREPLKGPLGRLGTNFYANWEL